MKARHVSAAFPHYKKDRTLSQGSAVTYSINPVATRGHQSAPKRNQTGPRRDTRALPGWTIDAIRDGHPTLTGHRAIASIAASTRQHGWTYTDYYAEMTDPSNRISDTVRVDSRGNHRSRTTIRSILHRAWDTAGRLTTRSPAIRDKTEARTEIARIRAAATSTTTYDTLPARTRVKSVAVLEAILAAAHRQGTLHPVISLRGIREETGIPVSTARAHRDRLKDAGWIVEERTGGVHLEGGDDGAATLDASQYLIRIPDDIADRLEEQTREEPGGSGSHMAHLPPGVTPPTAGVPFANPQVGGRVHVAWWGRVASKSTGEVVAGLGLYARQVWLALSGVPQLAASVAASGGVAKSTASKYLRVLAGSGLAVLTPSGWVRGSVGLDEVAGGLGVSDAREVVRGEHRREREAFLEFVGDRVRWRAWVRLQRRGVWRPGGGVLPMAA